MFNKTTYSLLRETIFTPSLIRFYINKFWKENFTNLENKHISILCQLEFTNQEVRTIGNLKFLNFTDKNDYIDYLKQIISLKTEVYHSTPIASVNFSFKINEGLAPNQITPSDITLQSYYNNKLPITINPELFGEVLDHIDNKWSIRLSNKAFINLIEYHNDKTIYFEGKFFKNNRLMFEWRDTIISENSFKRELGKSIYFFSKNNSNSQFNLDLQLQSKKAPFMKKVTLEGILNSSFITMDIETVNMDGKLTPYLICWYDGLDSKSYWITQFKSIDYLIEQMMSDLCVRKNKNKKIFLHNFSNFDGIFLLKALTKIGECKIIQREGKLLSLQFKGKNNIILTFRDSYLLLPSALKDLCNSFKSKISKELFPILLNDINYNGTVPDISLFPKITTDIEYMEYSNFFIKNNKE